MCVIYLRTEACPKCWHTKLMSWELGRCKEAFICIAMDYSYCDMVDIIHEGKMYKFGVDTKITPWPAFCDHDGYLMLDDDVQVYTHKDQGWESLYEPYYDEARDGYGPKPKKEEEEKVDQDNRRTKK